MAEESKQVAEMVRSGAYFEEARAWYKTLYIGPISERTFFLLVAALSGLIALLGFLAVMGLMPLTTKHPVLISTDRIDESVPRVDTLQRDGASMQLALQDFFLSTYVSRREGYQASRYDSGTAFVMAHSDAATADAYRALYDKANPQSPAATLGETGERVVTINAIEVDDSDTLKTATVNFTTELRGLSTTNRTQWTAAIEFHYTPLTVTPTINPNTGESGVATQDPQFQVLSYVLTKAK